MSNKQSSQKRAPGVFGLIDSQVKCILAEVPENIQRPVSCTVYAQLGGCPCLEQSANSTLIGNFTFKFVYKCGETLITRHIVLW